MFPSAANNCITFSLVPSLFPLTISFLAFFLDLLSLLPSHTLSPTSSFSSYLYISLLVSSRLKPSCMQVASLVGGLQGELGLIILRAGWLAAGRSSAGTNWNKTLPCSPRKRETGRDKDRIMSASAGNWSSVQRARDGKEPVCVCACVHVCVFICIHAFLCVSPAHTHTHTPVCAAVRVLR